jgi:lipoprotein-releasing system permease protein
MLLVLVILIFLVVMVNIFHAMRRSVYERREEISILSALGGHPRAIQRIFMFNGFGIGLAGSVTGLLCGLFVAANINGVFTLAEYMVNSVSQFLEALLLSDSSEGFSLFSPEYFYMQEIPVRIFFGEVFFVFVFGLFSATAAAWIASLKIASMKPAEVLRYE